MMLALLLALAVVPKTDGPAPITVKLNHEEFSRGDKARVYVQTAQDGYLVVLHADPDGRVRVLFPRDPSDDAFVRGDRKIEIRSRSDREAFMIDLEDGAGTVVAVISPDGFKFDDFVVNDHWDYRALGQGTVKDDPLAGLLDIVSRMSGDKHFEYDVATYVVGSDVSSYGGYGHGYYGSYYPHYRYRFGYYDPFYDPFCYDPFWGSTSCFGYGYNTFGFGVGYGFGGFYPRRPYSYGFGRPLIASRPRVVIPAGTSRGRFTPVEPRPRSGSGTLSPPVRSFGGSRSRDGTGSRGGSVAPRDRGGRSASGGRSMTGGGRSSTPRSGGVSRPSSRPSNGGGRRH